MTEARTVSWIQSTRHARWEARPPIRPQELTGPPDVAVLEDRPKQVVEGIGVSFSELSWQTLNQLDEQSRDSIMRDLFADGAGANLTMGRLPIGANDFSRGWYSYDETDGDFGLAKFSIDNDWDTLIPFVHAALAHRPELTLWASPWSPPTWLKTNGHYAAGKPLPWQHDVENGLRDDQVGLEGTDMMIQDDRYLRTYAAYFGAYVDAYRKAGIRVRMVMPQNEFNSAQVFPSCTWTPEGLARFIAILGPEMESRGVETFVGTMERADHRLIEAVLDDPAASRYVVGAGFQWAGKHAVAPIRSHYPWLRVYQTEQECGDGKNDWRYCRYAWTQLRDYFRDGAHAYTYWNLALPPGGRSRWGWPQNSLVTVHADGTYTYNAEYHLLKHVSHHLQAGARFVDTLSVNGYENQIAFRNPDGGIVIVLHNDSADEMHIDLAVGGKLLPVTLAPDSFHTLHVEPAPG
ncbi:glycoside hydrolase family 30 protein [Nonomuraea monospora]|uniref:Glycoside hydrolase family 30 protein n=1 Tax=Nonomuraea monospora TaxID=568818 RepID=A0ABN3D3T5_9ACTN